MLCMAHSITCPGFGIGAWIDAPEICEVAVREKADRRYLFVLNYTSERSRILIKRPSIDLFTELETVGETELQPYDVRVFSLAQSKESVACAGT